jgi:hypothetical protein
LITLAHFNPQMIADEQASLIPSSAMVVSALVSAAAMAGLFLYMRKNARTSEAAFQQERALQRPQSFTFED